MRIVVPFGFYGAGNIGDEATLNGFSRLLKRSSISASVRVASRNPVHTARVEPAFSYFRGAGRDVRRWFAKATASAHAFVGGTPIMDVLGDWPLCELTPLVQSTDRWKVPVSFIGIGTESLRSETSRRIVAGEIAPRVRHWSVRCDHDRARLMEYGVAASAITVAADMAWLIEAASLDYGRDSLKRWKMDFSRPVVGVNVVNENQLFERHPQVAEALAATLDRLVDQLDAQVVFLSNEVRSDASFDKQTAALVVQRMKQGQHTTIAPADYLSPAQMMSIIGCCDLTISMRYHFCIFSALQQVPFVAIQRSDKVRDLCWDIGWPAGVVPPALDADEMVGHALRLVKNADAKMGLGQSVLRMRDRALGNLIALDALRSRVAVAAVSSPATN